MQHTEHKAQRKKRRLNICLEAGFRPPSQVSYIILHIHMIYDIWDVFDQIWSLNLGKYDEY